MKDKLLMKNKFLMPMKLQFFADPDGEGDPGEATPPELNVEELNEEQLALIKEKYGFKDDKDVDSIVKSKKSRWQKEAEAEKNEAAKYAEMTAEEKIQHELAKKDARIAEFERKEVLSKMSEQASEMLSEKGATPTKEMLRLIVSEDAETTSANVKTYLASVEAEREAIKAEFEKRLGGRIPLDGDSGNGAQGDYGKQLAKKAAVATPKQTYFKN